MKSLDQIEARIPLVAGQPGVGVGASDEITISNSGSYYLTQNLVISAPNTTAINFGANDVTLDLNGFSILCTNTGSASASTAGIYANGIPGQRITIRNGTIRGGGTNTVNGINLSGATDGNALVENIHCYNVRYGILVTYGEARSIVRNCSVESAGRVGIGADVVTGCTVRNTSDDGIRGNIISDCFVIQETTPANAMFGYQSVAGSVVNNSIGKSKDAYGIYASSVINSHAFSGNGTALRASTAINCVGYRPGGRAIEASVANGCYNTGGTNLITYKYNMP
jgi:hypothetical protein